MPLIYSREINEYTKLGVWHIEEGEDFFLQTVQPQRYITHSHKRLQHLAGRLLLSTMYPSFPTSLIQIAETRHPFLINELYHFSISHCGDFAAAIVSTKNRVGVDVEIHQSKIETIKHKFLSEQELNLLQRSNNYSTQFLTMAWNVKEAVFKWYALGQVDFIKHIQIHQISKTSIGFLAECTFSKNEIIHLQVHNTVIHGCNVGWVVL